MTTSTARAALGPFSPGSGPGTTQREVLQVTRSFQLAIQRVFAAQRLWLSTNWRTLLTPAQRRRLVEKAIGDENPLTWGGWNRPAQQEIQKPMERAMNMGGQGALTELSQAGIAADWSLSNPASRRWMAAHGGELIRGINSVTLQRIKVAINQGLRGGESVGQISARVQGVMSDMTPRRAALIAQTETIRAQAEGSLQVYEEGGVQSKQWVDLRPRHCPRCASLHGKVVPIRAAFTDDLGITVMSPPRHPGCQCRVVAVVDEFVDPPVATPDAPLPPPPPGTPRPRRPRAARRQNPLSTPLPRSRAPNRPTTGKERFSDTLPEPAGDLGTIAGDYTPQMAASLDDFAFLNEVERELMRANLQNPVTKPFYGNATEIAKRESLDTGRDVIRMNPNTIAFYHRLSNRTYMRNRPELIRRFRTDKIGQIPGLDGDQAMASTLFHETVHQYHRFVLHNTGALGLEKEAELIRLYRATKRKVGPDTNNFVTSYAATNEAEYLAVSSEFFARAPLTLWDTDRAMFEFLNTQVFVKRYKMVGRGKARRPDFISTRPTGRNPDGTMLGG